MSDERHSLLSCEHCGNVYRWQSLSPREAASCARCESTLWRYSGLTPANWLALTLATLITFGVANVFPVATLSVQGMNSDATFLDAVVITWRQDHWAVALMTGTVGFAIPFAQILLLLWVLLPLSRGQLAPGFRGVMRLLGLVKPWSMVPVFLLGVVVSVVKLAGMASVKPAAGLIAFAFLTVLLTILSRLSPAAVWRMAEQQGATEVHVPDMSGETVLTGCHVCGQVQALPDDEDPEATHHCRRCDAVLHYRKPEHLARTWALLLAAAVFYIPANVLPVMNISSLLGDSAHTILGGVIELWETGGWDIALIVFVASVVVPLTKILSLAFLAFTAQQRSATNLRQRTRLYQLVEFIGQWSMLDVFVVILLAALADFPGLMQISAAPGAAAFGVVVVLTMLAAMSFDMRRAWDCESHSEWVEDHPHFRGGAGAAGEAPASRRADAASTPSA
ncbi:paraquat-inducible protein A [Bordetella genomosp. 1]|uniref:Paraquat-inducible membrane protein A n=1 Tax=Bordetella genomosp. 1 TaxID=1395607 RepID=A0ABX4F1L5_9BORD|nr:PqiA/YebS family transporter subunit [Bordetella genomosp. 1]OZI65902.1 paraquat-inducible membrane protein A [Bordetella genomosp. 1]